MSHPYAGSSTPATAGGDVQLQFAEGVATIEFSHPKGNSLPGALLRRLAAEITEVGTHKDVRVIVLRSAGEGPFCAGASFDELKSTANAETGTEFFMGFARLILAMKHCPRAILARVHGKAVGGGVGIVAASDYAMAHAGASVRLSELAVGIGPFVVGPAVERRVGSGPFAAMAIDADWRDARWAAQHGLYARVYDTTAELDHGVSAFAKRLAASSPDAMAEIKRVSWEGTEHWDELLPQRAATSGRLVLSEFTRNAIAAFEARGTKS